MDNSDKNQKAFLVGIFLIALVVLIFISKNYIAGQNSTKKEDSASIQQADSSEKMTLLSDKDLAEMILARKPVIVLDIRDSQSFKLEHIIDSKNVSNDDLAKILTSLDKNKNYVVVDYTGENSVVNIDDNTKKLSNLYLLSGGFSVWKSNQNQTIAIGDPNSFADQSKVSYVKAEDLKKMIDDNVSNLYVIDTRDKASFTEGHIKNATNIFLDDIEKRRNEIPHNKKIITYGQDGLGGFQAGTRLFDLGILNALVIPDGLDGWKQRGFEVVK